MTTDNNVTREERYGATRNKHISITESAHSQIEAWADERGYYFSVAIETLALIGLGLEEAAVMPRLVENAVERVLRWQFHRIAKLLSITAITATEANLKADALLLQVIRAAAEAHPETFPQRMTVSTDPSDEVAARIRQMREEMRALMHEQAIANLRRPLDQIEQILLLDEDEEEQNGSK